MKKLEFIDQFVVPLIRGRNLSKTDINLTFCDMIESCRANRIITDKQSNDWWLSDTSVKKLKKITKCMCDN